MSSKISLFMKTKQSRACALVRVSSEEQARGGYGLQFQEQDIRTFCKRCNLDLIKVFRDEGYSGATSNRPGFQEMMEWAREKRFDVLVVWKLDRLFRDTKLTLQTVDELGALGIEFRSVQESFTHDSNGRFLLTIFAAGAEKERKDIALRMYAGRTASARKGTLLSGASIPPYGYRYNKGTKRLEIDKEEAAIVQKLFRWLVEEKMSIYKIQSRLNDLRIPTKFDRMGLKKPTGTTNWWSKRTIGRILAKEVYTGRFIFRQVQSLSGGRNVSNLWPEEDCITVSIPSIISKQLFEQAREQLKTNAVNSPRRTERLYLLGKLLICGHDGRHMQAATRTPGRAAKERKYYFCRGTQKSVSAIRCRSQAVSEPRVAAPVWDKLKELLSHPETVLPQLAQYQEEKTLVSKARQNKRELEHKRRLVQNRMRRLVEVYVSGAVDKVFFESERRRLQDQADDLDREMRKAESLALSADRIIASRGTIETLYGRYKDKLENTSDEQKRELFQTFIKAVVVRGEDLEIEVSLPSFDSFAGQATSGLSRKDTPSLFMKTRVLPVSKIFRRLGMQKNFKKSTAQKPAP